MAPAKALALADSGDIDQVAVGEDVDADLLADLVLAHVVEAQLDELDTRVDPGLVEVAGLGLVQLVGVACGRT